MSRVIETSQFAILNAESILPDMKNTSDGSGGGGCCGSRIGGWLRRCSIVTKLLTRAMESRSWCRCAFSFRSLSVSTKVSNGKEKRVVVTYALAFLRMSFTTFLGSLRLEGS